MLINFKTISGLEIWILNIPDISRFARNKKLKHFRSDFRFQISSHLDHKGQQNNLMVNFQSGAIQDAERIDWTSKCELCVQLLNCLNQICDLNMQIIGK